MSIEADAPTECPEGALQFPDGFLLGCASAAHQVEGGNENDWSRMERDRPGAIVDGSVSGMACDQFHRYRADLELCAHDLGNTAHRFSVEWSRVEPYEGVFSHEALRHYAAMARTCRELGMEPIVTLQHFTLPLWLADRGGVLSPAAPRLFARFSAAVATALGADVRWWVTINEPTIQAVLGHLLGSFPPNHTSLPETLGAFRGLLRMHLGATTAIRTVAARLGHDPRISIAHHERRLLPRNRYSPADRSVAALPDFLFNRWFLRCCTSGRLLPPVGRGQRIPGLGGSLDYIGLNYYTEEAVSFDFRAPTTLFSRPAPRAGFAVDTFGNGIDPPGLGRAIRSLWREFRLPIMITENGVADTNDELRADYLVSHLREVLGAVHDGVDVRGYLHWTQLDNFEWVEGYGQRFGLYEVDRETQERRAKPSAKVYAEICRTRGLPRAAAAGATNA